MEGFMEFRRPRTALIALLFTAGFLTISQPSLATAGWDAFVQQQLDVNSAGWQRVGSLLSPTQQKQLTDLDSDVLKLDDQVSQAGNAGQLNQKQMADLRAQLGKIQSKQTDFVSAGVMRFPDAETLLLDLNTLKANLKAESAGQTKPTENDYFDAKDAFAFRDHLLRKLFYYRSNGTLSSGEYDELKSHVDHLGDQLDANGAKEAHNAKLLARCRDLEKKINKVISGAGVENHMVNGTP
jgi:hypothetical protein